MGVVLGKPHLVEDRGGTAAHAQHAVEAQVVLGLDIVVDGAEGLAIERAAPLPALPVEGLQFHFVAAQQVLRVEDVQLVFLFQGEDDGGPARAGEE